MAKSKTPTEEAQGVIVRGQVDQFRQLLANGLPLTATIARTHTPLSYAVDQRQPAIVRLLLESGADPNYTPEGSRSTPLILAAKEGLLPMVSALLAAGADIHARDGYNRTALYLATGTNTGAALQVVEALLAAGARPEVADLGNAANNGSPAVLRALVAAGVDPNDVARDGTPLIQAILGRRPDSVEALLRLGADPAVRMPADHANFAGQTAREVAQGQTATKNASRLRRAKKVLALLDAAVAGPLPPPAVPPTATTDDVPALWQRIGAAFGGDSAVRLRPGATEEQLAAIEEALGVRFPDDFRASYSLVDGQEERGDGLVPTGCCTDEEYQLLSLESVLSEWRPWRELTDGNEFRGRVSSPDPGVRDDWWHPGWVPFASNGGGDSLCIDLAPAEGGTVGQIIAMSHETGWRPVVGRSFAEFLALLARHLEETEPRGEPGPIEDALDFGADREL